MTEAANQQATGTSDSSDSKGRYSIAVLGKALDLLDALDSDDPLTLTQLSAQVGIPKATALRVLANLEDRGFVERDDHGQYRLGVRILQLGSRKSSALDLRTLARPAMRTLHAEFDETVNLAVPAEDGIVYIDILQSPRGLRMAATVGMRDDYYSSALGKAMMSSWSDAQIDQTLRSVPLERKTEHTLLTIDAVKRSLIDVRSRGFALDDEENEIGARCVGAPIFDHRGVCIAAISVSGSASRLTPERIAEVGRRVRVAAATISRAMGSPRSDVPAAIGNDTRT